MAAVITVHEATIHSMQVSIQTLRVGTKQVTMGLFRQLPRRDLIDPETLTFNGIPWGVVNYWWSEDGLRWNYRWKNQVFYRENPHHIVWQQGEVLCRDIVYQDLHASWLEPFEESASWYTDQHGTIQEEPGGLARRTAYLTKWRQQWTALSSLPQLFIAV